MVLGRQTAVAAGAATSELYGLVSEGMQAINRTFLERPELKRYFYEDVAVDDPLADPSSQALAVRVETMCESLMDFADSVVEQKRAYPTRMDWTTWDAYFRFLYGNSPALRQFLCDNADYYPDYTLGILGLVHVRDTSDGALLSRWQVFEAPASLASWDALPRVAPAAVTAADRETDDPCGAVEGRDEAVALACRTWPALAGAEEPGYRPPSYPWVRTWLIRRLGTDHGICLARVVPEGGDTVRVRMLEQGVGSRAGAVLRAWIVGTMRSTGVRRVVFAGNPGDVHYDPNVKRSLESAQFRIHEYSPRRRGFAGLSRRRS